MTIRQDKNVPIKTFGGRVKFIRESNDLTQTQFAEKIGVKPSFISKVERDAARFTIDHIVLIRTIFNFDMNWLLIGEGEKRSLPEAPATQPIIITENRQWDILTQRLQRIIQEGDKTKLEAVKATLKAFDPGEKKQTVDSFENEGVGTARNRAA